MWKCKLFLFNFSKGVGREANISHSPMQDTMDNLDILPIQGQAPQEGLTHQLNPGPKFLHLQI